MVDMSLSRRALALAGALDESHHIASVSNIILASLIAAGFLWKIPRIIARFSQISEWTQGHVLYTGRRTPFQARRIEDNQSEYGAESSYTTEDRARTEKRRAKLVYPRHVRASNVDMLAPVAAFLRRVVSPGFSLGQLCVLAIYFGILVYAGFYHSNPFTDPTRSGVVAVSQLPLLFIFGTKNNIAGMLLGAGYERLNYIHRFLGRAFIVAANIHSVYYLFKWADTWQQNIMVPANAWGLAAVVAMDIMFLFSTAFWRLKAYNIFLISHFVGFSIVLPGIWFHKPRNIPYVIATLAIYAFSTVLQVVKTRIATANLRPVPSMEATRVEIPSLTAGWRAGQHVRLRVLSPGMGWFGWLEPHPFTISSVSGTGEGIVLICKCKQAGSWTDKLYEGAKTGGYVDGAAGRQVKVLIEGPYGGPGFVTFESYSAAVFVVGGSGITFALAAIQELIKTSIVLVASSSLSSAALTPLFPLFVQLIERSTLAPLRISVYYTRAPAPGTAYSSATLGKFAHPRFTVCPGRPRLGKVLEAVISRAVSLGSVKDSQRNCGVIVAVCGPLGMADDCIAEIALVEPRRRDAVGGIEVYEEAFS